MHTASHSYCLLCCTPSSKQFQLRPTFTSTRSSRSGNHQGSYETMHLRHFSRHVVCSRTFIWFTHALQMLKMPLLKCKYKLFLYFKHDAKNTRSYSRFDSYWANETCILNTLLVKSIWHMNKSNFQYINFTVTLTVYSYLQWRRLFTQDTALNI